MTSYGVGLCVCAALFLGNLASAQETLVDSPPSSAFKFEVIEFKAKEKHHFELNAPNECLPGVVISRKKDSIKCQFSEVGQAKATLNICDDDKTFCKLNELSLNITEAPKGYVAKPLNEDLLSMKQELHDQLLPGFISGTPEEIKALAEKENQPVLVMISTDWCPPCNQSKEYLLSTKAFQEMTKDWLKVYVDGDSKDSRAWAKVVSYNSYPTLALMNSSLEELSQFRMEFTQKQFSSWMERVNPYLNDSYSDVSKRVLARKNGEFLRWVLDFVTWTSSVEKTNEKDFVLEMAIAKNDEGILNQFEREEVPELLIYDWFLVRRDQLLEKGMSEADFHSEAAELAGLRPSYFYHLMDLCEKTPEKCKDTPKAYPERIAQLESSDRTESEKLGALSDEYYSQMLFFKSQKKNDLSIVSAKACVDSFEKMLSASTLKNPRYAEQGIIACAKSFDLNRVDGIYQKMMAAYPKDPTFVSRYVRFLKDDKKDLKRAKVFAQQAMDLSYDFNWFFAATTKVQIDKALGLKEEAKQTISEAFSRLDLSQGKDALDQKIASRLRTLEQSL